MRQIVTLAVAVGAMLSASALSAAPLFSDDFNSNTAANYNIVQTSDTSTQFAFDYSTVGIPAAPSTTDGSTLGLRMAANIVSPGTVDGVTLHTLQQFTGAYRVKFDAWVNANGPFPGGGAGSTEMLNAGVGGDGATNNLHASPVTGSGAWTSVSGEGGTTRDYRIYKDANEQFAESGQMAAGNSSVSGGAHQASDAYYMPLGSHSAPAAQASAYPQQTGSTGVGTFGMTWREVELVVDPTGGTGGAASMIWIVDGLTIAEIDSGIGSAVGTNGSVTIGYSDIFTSISDNADLSFGLIDNLQVVPEPASAALAALGLIGTLAARRRRRA